MGRASSCSDTPQRNRNNIPDLLRAMPVKLFVKDGKISSQTTMRKRLERFGEVRIVDGTNGFGLDIVEKTESGDLAWCCDVDPLLFSRLIYSLIALALLMTAVSLFGTASLRTFTLTSYI